MINFNVPPYVGKEMVKPSKTILSMVKKTKIFLPVIMGAIFFALYIWLIYQIPFWKVYAPNTTWNDDALYYKQLTAILTNGYPRGFFGYNESRAYIGSFGSWGPILFYIYALPAYFIGVNPNTMVWCNIIFMLIGWCVFVNCTHISWKRQILFALVISFMQMPVRYVVSGMQEALGYAITLSIIGLCYAELKSTYRYRFICLLALCVIYSLIRPYAIVFWIFPMLVLIKRKQYRNLWGCCFMGGGTFVLSVLCMSKLAAPYLVPLAYNYGLQLFLSGDLKEGITQYFQSLINAMQEMFHFIFNEWQTGTGFAGLLYADTLLLASFILICLFWDWKQKKDIRLKICVLTVSLLIFFIISSFYSMHAGSRHMLILCVGMIAVLIIENQKSCVVLAVGLFVISYGIRSSETVYQFPMQYTTEKFESINNYADIFTSRISVDKEVGISWDNTLAYDANVNFTWLYCVPDGLGIEFDMPSYLQENEIKSKYVMTQTEGMVYDRLINEEYELIIETADFVVFERPNQTD